MRCCSARPSGSPLWELAPLVADGVVRNAELAGDGSVRHAIARQGLNGHLHLQVDNHFVRLRGLRKRTRLSGYHSGVRKSGCRLSGRFGCRSTALLTEQREGPSVSSAARDPSGLPRPTLSLRAPRAPRTHAVRFSRSAACLNASVSCTSRPTKFRLNTSSIRYR